MEQLTQREAGRLTRVLVACLAAVALLAGCAPPPRDASGPSLEDDTLAVLRAAYEDAQTSIGTSTHDAPLVSVTTASARDDDERMLASAAADGWRIAPELAAAFAATSAVEEHAASTIERWTDVAWTPSPDARDTGVWTVRLSVPAFGRERRVAVVRCDAFHPGGFGSFGNILVVASRHGVWEVVARPASWIA